MLNEMVYPRYVLLAEPALRVMHRAAIDAYEAAGTEWGGLLYGLVVEHPGAGPVLVILVATSGRCHSTGTSCEILPNSWEDADTLLRNAGLTGLLNVGDWHSHPTMRAFLSQGWDIPSFWSNGHVPHWTSVVIDPYHDATGSSCVGPWLDFGAWVKDSPLTLSRTHTVLASSTAIRQSLVGVPSLANAWAAAYPTGAV